MKDCSSKKEGELRSNLSLEPYVEVEKYGQELWAEKVEDVEKEDFVPIIRYYMTIFDAFNQTLPQTIKWN